MKTNTNTMKYLFATAMMTLLGFNFIIAQSGYIIPEGCEKAPLLLDCSIPETDNDIEYINNSMSSEQEVGYQVINSNALEARQKGWNAKDVVIAVFDTGVAEHPDLPSSIVKADYTGDTSTDEDGNLFLHPHGTHVASIIASIDNEIGTLGVCGSEKIMDVRVLNSVGSGSSQRITQAVLDVTNGVYEVVPQIINMSLGSRGFYQPLDNAIKYAESKGIVVICAMGNDGTHGKPESADLECGSYPARSTKYGGVAAIDQENRITSFSSRSQQVMSSGQGFRIKAAITKGAYAKYSGTSIAAPAEAGKIALIMEIRNATPMQALELYMSGLRGASQSNKHQYGKGWYVFENIPTKDGSPKEPIEPEPNPQRPYFQKFGFLLAIVLLAVGGVIIAIKNK